MGLPSTLLYILFLLYYTYVDIISVYTEGLYVVRYNGYVYVVSLYSSIVLYVLLLLLSSLLLLLAILLLVRFSQFEMVGFRLVGYLIQCKNPPFRGGLNLSYIVFRNLLWVLYQVLN